MPPEGGRQRGEGLLTLRGDLTRSKIDPVDRESATGYRELRRLGSRRFTITASTIERSRVRPAVTSSRRAYRFAPCRSSRSRSSMNESGTETGSKQSSSSQAW